MRILIVGASGQVGSRLVDRARAEGHQPVGAYRSHPVEVPGIESVALDKSKPAEVERVVRDARPDVVIDTGALHNVDYCETHPDEALAVNRDGTGLLSRAAAARGARFLFVSTDFVFDGSGHPPYSESDPPHPQSVYARSKLEGEQAALAGNPNAAVARPSVIYSWVPMAATIASSSGKPLNFASWFLRQLADGKPARIVTDQVASPTLADDLAGALLALAGSTRVGVFHTAGATPLSRFDFCRKLVERFGLPPELLTPTDSASLAQAAARPRNSSLVSHRLERDVGYSMLDLDSALDRLSRSVRSDPGLPPSLRH